MPEQIATRVSMEHRVHEILTMSENPKHIYVGCECGYGPVTFLGHAAHVAEVAERLAKPTEVTRPSVEDVANVEEDAANAPTWLAELLAEVERLTERLTERAEDDVRFRVEVIESLLDALGLTDDTNETDAKEILDGCDCNGEDGGTLHLVWHLGQKVDALTRWKFEAMFVMAGLQELGDALKLPLGERITGTAGAEAARLLTARAEAAEQELDRLRLSDDYKPEGVDIVMAKLAEHRARAEAAEQATERVRAQCHAWSFGNSWNKAARKAILRALDGES